MGRSPVLDVNSMESHPPREHDPRRRAAGAVAQTRSSVRIWYAGLQDGISPVALCGFVLVFAAADVGSQMAGDSLFPGGPLDEIAHALTTLLVLWAVGGRLYQRFLTSALIASVAIDIDHIPARLGARWLTDGTPRPYTHSLATVLVVLLVAFVWRRRREVLLGVVVGLMLHFWRDLSEFGSSVALLWPLTKHAFSLPHPSYLVLMAVAVAGAMRQSIRLQQGRRGRGATASGSTVAETLGAAESSASPNSMPARATRTKTPQLGG
jgi:MYXO-CTERM domain-containing protein